MTRRLRVRQNPVSSFVGGIVGCAFVVIGVVEAIPRFGAFSVVWTLVSLIGSWISFYNAFSDKGIANEIIEVSDDDVDVVLDSANVEARLRQLDSLKAKSLLTPVEYQDRRRKILDEL